MNRKKRIVIISMIVISLLLCIMAAILGNREGRPLPLAVTFRNENGHSLANYEVSMPSKAIRDFSLLGGTRIQRSASKGVQTILLTYSGGAWHPEVRQPTVKSTNGMLQLSIPEPTEPLWKLKVTSIERNHWRVGNGIGMSSPFGTSSQVFESQVFTNAVSVLNQ